MGDHQASDALDGRSGGSGSLPPDAARTGRLPSTHGPTGLRRRIFGDAGPDQAMETRFLVGAQAQLQTLAADLEAICRIVEPTRETLSVHGHAIRNLILLAATEVEMHWRGVLVANGRDKGKKASTYDYAMLAEPLRLKQYTVLFPGYPDLDAFQPFEHWDVMRATSTLEWYSAYNAVKHDREEKFRQARLEHGFAAVAACAILLVAQFGELAVPQSVRRLLHVQTPGWENQDLYIGPIDDAGWVAATYPFVR